MLEYNPINPLLARKGWDVNQRDHRKLLIVDGKTAFVGGINISSVYSSGSLGSGSSNKDKKKPKKVAPKTEMENNASLESIKQNNPAHVPAQDDTPWRDTHMQMTGPVVAEFQKLFFETWKYEFRIFLTGRSTGAQEPKRLSVSFRCFLFFLFFSYFFYFSFFSFSSNIRVVFSSVF